MSRLNSSISLLQKSSPQAIPLSLDKAKCGLRGPLFQTRRCPKWERVNDMKIEKSEAYFVHRLGIWRVDVSEFVLGDTKREAEDKAQCKVLLYEAACKPEPPKSEVGEFVISIGEELKNARAAYEVEDKAHLIALWLEEALEHIERLTAELADLKRALKE